VIVFFRFLLIRGKKTGTVPDFLRKKPSCSENNEFYQFAGLFSRQQLFAISLTVASTSFVSHIALSLARGHICGLLRQQRNDRSEASVVRYVHSTRLKDNLIASYSQSYLSMVG
jgi:hypothetical protein